MNVAVIGGQCDTKSFVIAVHVAILARQKFPPFRYKTQPVEKQDLLKWIADLCEEENWSYDTLRKEPVVCWYEVGAGGGPKRLLGGLYAFLEYMSDNYGVHRQLTLEQVETIVELRKLQLKHDNEYDRIMRSLKTTLTISIVGAGSNKAIDMIIYALLRLKGSQMQDGLYIRLFDKFESNQTTLKKVKKYFNAMENRMGYGFISIFKNFKQLVEGCDVLLFLGENFRTPGMDVEKFLYKERVLYGVYGVLCNRYVKSKTRIVFCCMENSCFNATAFIEMTPSLNLGRLVVLTSHLGAELKIYISKVSGFPVKHIVDIPVWGMVDVSHMVDIAKGRLLFRYPKIDSYDFPNYDSYAEKCGPAMNIFIKMLQNKRKEKQLGEKLAKKLTDKKARELKKEERMEKVKKLLGLAKRLQKSADEGNSEAMALLQQVREEVIELSEEAEFNFAVNLNAFSEGIIALYNKKWKKPEEGKEKSTELQQLLKNELEGYLSREELSEEECDEHSQNKFFKESNEVFMKDVEHDKSEAGPDGGNACKHQVKEHKKISLQEFKEKCVKEAEEQQKSEEEEEEKMFEEESSSCSEAQDEKYEMRNLGYITNSLKNMWNFVGVAKEAVRKESGQEPFMSQVWELTNLLRIWFLDPCQKNEVIFLGIVSNGSYTLPNGCVMSQPATLNDNQCWEPYYDDNNVFPEDLSANTYNPHRDPPNKKLPKYPEPYTLKSVISAARMCLKHFSIPPEVETIDDIVAKRMLEKDLINWRLQKMQTKYEYEELKMIKLDEIPVQEEDILPQSSYSGEMEEEVFLEHKHLSKQKGMIHGEQVAETEVEELVEEEEEGYKQTLIADNLQAHEGTEIFDEEKLAMYGSESGYKHSKKKSELCDSQGRDLIHMKYLKNLGFYDVSSGEEDKFEDEIEDLGPDFEDLMKTAYKEYFGYSEENEVSEDIKKGKSMEKSRTSKRKRRKRRGLQVWGEHEIEDEDFVEDIYGEDYTHTEGFDDGNTTESSSVASTASLPCGGIGIIRDLEDQFNSTQLISTPYARMSPGCLPQYDKKHEYEKSDSKKPGFPLDLDGKSTIDTYKLLLTANPSEIRDKFQTLANKIDLLYKEELSRGNIIEEDDGRIVLNRPQSFEETDEKVEKPGQSTCFGEFEMNESSDSMISEHSSKLSPESSSKSNLPTIPTDMHVKEAWKQRDEIDKEEDDSNVDRTTFEKAIQLGILQYYGKQMDNRPKKTEKMSFEFLNPEKTNEVNDTAKGIQMTKEETEKLVECREKLWKKYKQTLENEFQLDGVPVKLQELHKDVMLTEDDIKVQSQTFIEFVKMSREQAWKGGIYHGDKLPAWSFPNKPQNVHFDEFKMKTLVSGKALCLALLKQKQDDYANSKHEFFGSSEDEQTSS